MECLPSPADAEAIVRARSRRLPTETRKLAASSGAVLAQQVRAERDQPPFDRVTMDGIAIASSAYQSGRRCYRIAGTQPAGHEPLTLTDPDDCIEVMTGAELPRGSDCIIPLEFFNVIEGRAEIGPDAFVDPGRNVHPRASDSRKDDILLEPGTGLGPPEIAAIASAGLANVEVRSEPRLMVISTGDELIEPGEPVQPWQIRRSNTYSIRASLISRGFRRISDEHLADDPRLLSKRLARHLADHDLIVLTGGVSTGRYDFVPSVLRELGVRPVFHRVAQRPGMPIWFGVTDEGCSVYGLPGNPVSALVCLARLVIPGIEAALGATASAIDAVALAVSVRPHPDLWFFLPVILQFDAALGRVAVPKPVRGSGDIISLLGTGGFVELPPGKTDIPAGHIVPLFLW